jgi:DNA (cytosine-5)-methyltransferase 1
MNKILTLFSNIGVGEALLNPATHEVVLANELHQERADIYSKLYPSHAIIVGSIIDKQDEIITKARLLGVNTLVATPPCQSFSALNAKRIENDPRDQLVIYAVNIAKELQPDTIIFENVAAQRNLTVAGLSYDDYIRVSFPNYNVFIEVLNAADFGVPQRRRRLFTIISKGKFTLPPKKQGKTVRDTIGHLETLESGQKSETDSMHYAAKHADRHILWARNTPTGKSAFDNLGVNQFYPQKDGRKIEGFKSTYKRLDWDTVSCTITAAHGSPSSSNTLHPGRPLSDGTFSDARTLSIREAALLMGLPETFTLPDNVSYKRAIHFLGEGLSPVVLRDLLLACQKPVENDSETR